MTTQTGLQPIADLGLTDSERLGAIFKRWCAIDPETGAFLSASNGRTKYGDTKYILILPTKTPAERGGLFADYDWTEKDRKRIRAWSLSEAIEIANKRLEKMVATRRKESIRESPKL